jgi:hypothetical protein
MSQWSGGIRYRLQHRHTTRTRSSTSVTIGPSLTGLRGTQLMGSIIYTLVTMSLSLPPSQGSAVLWVHMDATLQPARRIIARLLEADASFFSQIPLFEPALCWRFRSSRVVIYDCNVYSLRVWEFLSVLMLLSETCAQSTVLNLFVHLPQFCGLPLVVCFWICAETCKLKNEELVFL